MLMLFGLAEQVILLFADRLAHPVVRLMRDTAIQRVDRPLVETTLEFLVLFL
jgi:hypothetical protein